jgi:hypothetical protein
VEERLVRRQVIMKFDLDLLCLFIIMVSAILISLLSNGVCLDRLRRRHVEVWKDLGRPTIWRQELDFFLPLLLFFYRGKFARLGDSFLVFFAVLRMLSDVIGMGLFIFLFVKTFAG